MNKIYKLNILLLILTTIICLPSCSPGEKKNNISIVYPNWAEGIAISNMAKKILEKQGYNITLMNADIAPLFASLSNGKADVFLDAWVPVTHQDYLNQYGKNLETLGEIYDSARVGFVVPDYVNINSIEELNANKNKFSGEIIGIDVGAGIMKSAEKAIQEYGLDFHLKPSSGPAMTALLKKAIENKQWIIITGWSPHWMFSDFRLKFLNDPKNTFGKTETIESIATKGFSQKQPFAAELLKNIKLDTKQLASLISKFNKIQDEGEAAESWISENQELINSWLPTSSPEISEPNKKMNQSVK
ncbi:glycine betaine ABC transporter substrate-binding protein [Coprobacter secundus]|uniref:glycine betaine ABC transporter substrate-binding protein n=1 Tax=Coprobacter secundus TaxID=1501392 RepID=UPI0005C4BF0B|nr:glycine betaine ABC transporter substrate-binding protein [Coprobacter secundus]